MFEVGLYLGLAPNLNGLYAKKFRNEKISKSFTNQVKKLVKGVVGRQVDTSANSTCFKNIVPWLEPRKELEKKVPILKSEMTEFETALLS